MEQAQSPASPRGWQFTASALPEEVEQPAMPATTVAIRRARTIGADDTAIVARSRPRAQHGREQLVRERRNEYDGKAERVAEDQDHGPRVSKPFG